MKMMKEVVSQTSASQVIGMRALFAIYLAGLCSLSRLMRRFRRRRMCTFKRVDYFSFSHLQHMKQKVATPVAKTEMVDLEYVYR